MDEVSDLYLSCIPPPGSPWDAVIYENAASSQQSRMAALGSIARAGRRAENAGIRASHADAATAVPAAGGGN
ncbi:MAG: hypothetical protein JWM19_3847 [Actinomycetia bacterium]|nr:hypothetical protein [Actinomycetes bacterium]